MTVRVEINSVFFPWAVERARGDMDEFVARFPKLPDWISGAHKPTLKQLERFAAATHAPVGFFFLPEPPQESLPLPDFRTIGGTDLSAPSADLLDTIYTCQQRQDWFRDFARSTGMEPLSFIGTASTKTPPTQAAKKIQRTLDFSVELRKQCSTWTDALRHLVAQCEDHGILVMISGIVGNNTRRVLDPAEFRGFCLLDSLAPVVFVNGADSKSAQMFTLVHELAHLWLGESGVSNATLFHSPGRENEVWCNAVAAEVLVPLAELEAQLPLHESLDETVKQLCRLFKVSSLVMLRRLLDAGVLTRNRFDKEYKKELGRLANLKDESTAGGNFYFTEAARVSKRFATALLFSTYEGNTLFRDAGRLLAIKKVSTLNEFASRLGVR
jgi:Zn-dependent peptidase ImmA (M78 family)